MSKDIKIFLIRHGESLQNTGENSIDRLPDPLVKLTEEGEKQANQSGKFIKNFVLNNNFDISNATLWVSPFERTRQTAKIINSHLNIQNIKEDYALIEQKYGLFSDTPFNISKELYPSEFEHYDNYYQNNGKFYAKMPQGESPMDVALRVRLFLETIFRDLEEGKDTLFIVSHGTTIRTFLLNWFHYSPEWFNNEPTMENCSIRYIEKENGISYDNGYIYGGIKRKEKKR